jgi:hypothetical protein
MLGRRINEDAGFYNDIDLMMEEFPPKLLNQLKTKLGSAMNRASVHPLSIKYSEDRYIIVLHHSEGFKNILHYS